MICVFFNNTSNGPGKVAKNLIKGFKDLGVDFKKNPNIDEIKPTDKIISLQRSNIMNTNLINNAIIGPNICILPIENNIVMEQKYKKMIVPSEWVKNKYLKWLPEEKLFTWPVGIDTDLFNDKSDYEKTNDCLIYIKNRPNSDVNEVIKFLTSKNQTFDIIKYGSYNEQEFIRSISKSRYGIVIDNTESQGVAIEEMMSCNLPLLVWDTTLWDFRGPQYKVDATSIPYWDERCGEKFDKLEDMVNTYNRFINKLDSYKPREYVLENLSIKVCTNNILKLINE